MADTGDRLRIKFGLNTNPTQAQQKAWADLTDSLVALGRSREAAGAEAARRTFPDYGQTFYASEGDTIEFLLRQVRDK